MRKLDGKIALVTGSGRGIGRAIALKLASEGASVVVNDIDDGPGDAVAAEIKAFGGRGIASTVVSPMPASQIVSLAPRSRHSEAWISW